MKAGPEKAVLVQSLDFRDFSPGDERSVGCGLWLSSSSCPGAMASVNHWPCASGSRRLCGAHTYAPGVRTALVSLPRANGKTALAAALALAELFVGPPSAEVLVIASDQRQANITLRYAKRMIELNQS